MEKIEKITSNKEDLHSIDLTNYTTNFINQHFRTNEVCVIIKYLIVNNYTEKWINTNYQKIYTLINFLFYKKNHAGIYINAKLGKLLFGTTTQKKYVNTHISNYILPFNTNHTKKERINSTQVDNFQLIRNLLSDLQIIYVNYMKSKSGFYYYRLQIHEFFDNNFQIEVNDITYNDYTKYNNFVSIFETEKNENSEYNNVIKKNIKSKIIENDIQSTVIKKMKIYDILKPNNFAKYKNIDVDIITAVYTFRKLLNNNNNEKILQDKNNRMYHIFTSIKSEIRNEILSQNGYIEIDFSASNFQMLANIINEKIFDEQFYDDIKNEKIYDDIKNYPKYKKHAMYWLMRNTDRKGKEAVTREVFDILSSKYPLLNEFISLHVKNNIANELMKKESELMNECISTCELDDYIRVHDALYVKNDKVQEVKDFFKLKKIITK